MRSFIASEPTLVPDLGCETERHVGEKCTIERVLAWFRWPGQSGAADR